jgi:hypothetical protein
MSNEITELGLKRNHVPALGRIDNVFYETLFKVYKVDKHYVYNILRKVSIPDGTLDNRFFEILYVQTSTPWTSVSYKAYRTIKLWWLICIVNRITNPVYNAQPGVPIRILKSQYIKDILSTMDQV